ncbi:MAG: SDR family oxidoreductase [Mucilaginibacter sp.]|uniref:NAD-dependent epimerase/dehydratase family protein n=1 Tax=Mucilaginibacter sp. TaxID=1882438 RepID=UPI003266843A
MRLLIIGSKGFIGSHCMAVLNAHHTVYGCDVVTDYVSANYFQIDATNADYKEVFKAQQFDICINCSGAASVPDSFIHPFRDFSLNTLNVVKMLEAVKEVQPGCKFINLSSAAVYGNPVTLPITENTPVLPLSPYGLHKKQAEEIVKEYAAFFDIQTCSLRLFSVFGPGLRKQLFWDLHTKIIQSDHIKLWGTGNESRDFIYVEDVVNAISCVIEKADFKGECINISDGIETSIKSVVELFQQVHFKSFDFTFDGQQSPGYPVNWRADVSKLQSLGFKSTISLEQGLQKYIAWLQQEEK